MQLVQIGIPQAPRTVSVREMFERMAQRETTMVREGRERLMKQMVPNA